MADAVAKPIESNMTQQGKDARKGPGDNTATTASQESGTWLVELLADLSKRASIERPDGTVVSHRASVINIASLQTRLGVDVPPVDLSGLVAALLAL